MKVGGLTKSDCEQLIRSKILPYLNKNENPIVTVRMTNYKISVLGEVNRPGMFTVSNEKINILEALAQAGDLTIHGVRTKVKLIREDATGKKAIVTLNLNDANIINSPYYYLQQNDIVYVEPNKVKARNSGVGSTTGLWFTATSILVSLASLLYTILK
jgi:polysaccharide export outer membrane protein